MLGFPGVRKVSSLPARQARQRQVRVQQLQSAIAIGRLRAADAESAPVQPVEVRPVPATCVHALRLEARAPADVHGGPRQLSLPGLPLPALLDMQGAEAIEMEEGERERRRQAHMDVHELQARGLGAGSPRRQRLRVQQLQSATAIGRLRTACAETFAAKPMAVRPVPATCLQALRSQARASADAQTGPRHLPLPGLPLPALLEMQRAEAIEMEEGERERRRQANMDVHEM